MTESISGILGNLSAEKGSVVRKPSRSGHIILGDEVSVSLINLLVRAVKLTVVFFLARDRYLYPVQSN